MSDIQTQNVNNIYNKQMTSNVIVQNSYSMEYFNDHSDLVYSSQYEPTEETLSVGEEIVVDASTDTMKNNKVERNGTSYESLKPVETDALPERIHEDKSHSSDSRLNDNEMKQDDLNEDEETIATFITAAGQQLALYAVEDSDEIFAVAVYDESGEPPTSFQFLMKSDVERLIGEGAVRTVKKPAQLKKQLVTTQSPIFVPRSRTHSSSLNDDEKNIISKSSNGMKHKCNTLVKNRDEKKSHEHHSIKNASFKHIQDNNGSDHEILEQSTVQSILDDDESESELTFDEVEKMLRNLKSQTDTNRKSISNEIEFKNKTMKDHPKTRMILVPAESNQLDCNKQKVFSTLNKEDQNSICNNLNYNERNQEQNIEDGKQELLDVLMDSPPPMDTSDYIKDASESMNRESRAKRSRKQQLTSVNREDTEIIIQPATELVEEETRVVKKRRKRRGKVSKHKKLAKKIRRARRKEIEIIEIDVDEREQNIVEITLDDSRDKCSSDKENEVIELEDSEDDDHDSQSQSDSKTTYTLLQCEHCNRKFRQRKTLQNHVKLCSKSSNSVKLKIQNSETPNQDIEGTSKKQYSCKICQAKFDVVVALARHVRTLHSQRRKRSKSSTDDDDDEDYHADEDNDEHEQEKANNKTKRQRKYKVNSVKEWAEDTNENGTRTRNGRKNMKINQSKLLNLDSEFVETHGRISKRKKRAMRIKRLNCHHCGKQFLSRALLNVHFLQHSTKNREVIRRCQFCRKLIKSKSLFLHHVKAHRHSNMRCMKKSLPKQLRSTKTIIEQSTIKRRGKSQQF